MISLALIEDHPLIRSGLSMLLAREGDMIVVGEAGSLAEADALNVEPDIIVADLRLPDGFGAPVVRSLCERFPSSKVMVLSMVDDAAEVEACFHGGALGYVHKGATGAEVVLAVRTVAAGVGYVQPALGASLAGWRSRRTAGLGSRLTDREREVLGLLVLGHTNAEIAEKLFLSLRTIESHRASIQRKLGLHGRAELVRYAREEQPSGDG